MFVFAMDGGVVSLRASSMEQPRLSQPNQLLVHRLILFLRIVNHLLIIINPGYRLKLLN